MRSARSVLMCGWFVSIIVVGCHGAAPKPPTNPATLAAQAEKGRLETQAKFIATLPRAATDVRDEGGNNVSFSFEHGGRSRRYLAHYGWDNKNYCFAFTFVCLD